VSLDDLAHYVGRTPAETADVERIRALLADPDPWRRELPLHVTASALIVHPPTRRVLLRWHVRQQAWLMVGGHGDPGETDPVAIAIREGEEETGLTDLRPWPTPDLMQVVVVSVPAAPHEPAHEHADIRYVLATDTPDAAVPENPAAELRWLTVPEAQALTRVENVRELLARVELLFA
jgi:8-oxo-dGTP pyrophosphatase MutT (NUDIX family)